MTAPTKSPGSAEVRELEARRVAIVERWLARGENPPGLEDVSIAECALRLCADATAALLRAAHQPPQAREPIIGWVKVADGHTGPVAVRVEWGEERPRCEGFWRALTWANPHQGPAAPPQPAEQGQPRREFPVGLMGHPMREFAPGKWESAIWPSEAAEQGEQPASPSAPDSRDGAVKTTSDARGVCKHPWPSDKPRPASWLCQCGKKVYRSYEDYCNG